jgi:hypothetical protein
MLEIKSYIKGHRLLLVLVLTTMAYTMSLVGGNTILPLPAVFQSFTPPITIDAVLALIVVVAIGIFFTTALSYFESISRSPWWVADIFVLFCLITPSIVVWQISQESLIARDLAVYLLIFFPLTAYFGTNVATITLAMWVVAQSAIFQYESGPILWMLTIILQKSSTLQVICVFVGVIVSWVLFKTKIKQNYILYND